MIWGMTLEPGKLYTEVMGDEVHLSMASLESRKDFAAEEKTEATCHIIMKTEKSEYLLCTLANGVIYQQSLDLKLMPREKVTFSVQGTNVVYLTGYSTSYPELDDHFEEESETGDWEPYDTGELPLNSSTEENVALKEDEQIPPIIKDESEDIIEEMGDDGVQEQQQEEPVLELDLQTDMPELSQENTEQTKDEDESDQHEHEMIFSIAELEANVKEEPEDSVTIIPSDAEERLQEQGETSQDDQMLPQQEDQVQQLQEQQALQTQLQQQQRQLQHLPPDQQQQHQQQQLHPHNQYLPNVQQSMQDTIQSIPHQQRAALPINQRMQRFAQQRARARGRPVGSRLQTSQRQRVRYIPQTGHQQSFQQSQPSGNFSQMQNVQSTQHMPVGYQGTTVGNVASRGQVSVNPGMQGQAVLNQPGTSRQSVQGPSTSRNGEQTVQIQMVGAQPTSVPTSHNQAPPGNVGSCPQYEPGGSQPNGPRAQKQAGSGDSWLQYKTELGKQTVQVRTQKQTGKEICRFCGKKFVHASNAKRHERIHTGFKPYVCKFCNRSFNQSHSLTQHERLHTGHKPYPCEFCGVRFIRLSEKRSHEKKCSFHAVS
ncbi:uncharacterized protein [Apostichopus japonicus]|uniref:uncharacterized protein isoform X2 n=1 Tax=Stichopus japonicus TaxID=307972 RepID=UPI003AB224B9